MKNIIKYTLGLPLLIFLSLSIVTSIIVIGSVEFLNKLILKGDFETDYCVASETFNDILNIWKPIK